MPECIHELPQEQCSYCKFVEKPVYWDAMYPGSCPLCEREISVGDRVKWNTAGTMPVHARHGRD